VKTSRPKTSGASARKRVGAALRPGRGRAGAAGASVYGVKVSHPERIVYPDARVTKLQVAEYYASVAARLLPFIAERPLSILRCPDGLNAECFFQKHVGRYAIPGIDVVMIDESTGRNPYAIANRVEALVGLVQWNALELHAWGSTAPQIDRPDTLVLDLDPDPALPWSSVVAAARDVRALLEKVELVSFVKTTGGRGLHVVVPLQRRHSWEEVRDFARSVATRFARLAPDRFSATPGERHRRGKIFIDYLRNARGATAVAPYSLRARPGATVSTPLSWEELGARTQPGVFTIATVPERIRRRADAWTGYGKHRQRLSGKATQALGNR
jgi:bifunctional non-homologous end joining protein LigD